MLYALLLAALAAEPAVYVLEADAPVWDVTAEDLTGDGLKEICVLTRDPEDPEAQRRLLVFVADESGAYHEKAAMELVLEEEAGVLFFAEVDGAAPRELVAAHAEGATVYEFSTGAPRAIAETKFFSLLPSASKEPQFFGDTATDLDGDGIDEWLIPVASGYALMHADGCSVTVRCDVVSEVRRAGSTYITHRLPAYLPFSIEGETAKGLAFLSGTHADFVYGPQWDQHHRFTLPGALAEQWEAVPHMADINGDGFPDLMVTQTKGTIKLEATTQVYVATKPFEYPETPTATFTVKGAVSAPVITDVDGDGMGDLLMINVPFGIKNLMNLFLRNMVTAEIKVYLYGEEGFGSKPAYTTTLKLEAPEGRAQIAYALGDFNGDGRLDVALSRGERKFVIYLGEEKRFLSKKPWVTLEIPAFGRAKTHDLNGNGALDILLHHPGMENADRVEVLVF